MITAPSSAIRRSTNSFAARASRRPKGPASRASAPRTPSRPRGDEVTFQSLRHREIIAEEGGHWRLKVPLEITAVRAFSAGGAVRGSPDYAEGYAVEHRTFGKLLDQLKELTAAQAENWLRHCAGGAMGTRFVGLSSSGCPKTPKCPRCGAAHIRSLTSLPQRRKDYHGERLHYDSRLVLV